MGGTAAAIAGAGTAGAGTSAAGTAATGTAGAAIAGAEARNWLRGPTPEDPRIPLPSILYGPYNGSAAASLSMQTINESGTNISTVCKPRYI